MIGQCFRRRHLSVAALALFAVTACGSEAADTAEATGGAAPTAASQAGRAADSAGTAAASGQAGRTMTESDRLFLEMAEGGCNAVDFPSFFKAFSGSWAVREKYTAAMVTQGMTGKSSAQPRGAYLDRNDFPIAPMDYEFVTAASAAAFENKPDASWRDLSYVRLEFNTANDNRRRVDWLPGIFQKHQTPPPPELEEGLGELVRATGGGGTLLFFPTETCWELVEDVRNPTPQP
ncbi:MAG: hypothetical protein KKA44_05440 [Alphaproteobacteria bacterium]|nr:hypothetical protein [Alphaproteobacteria bacterium]MBU0864973.1 hypothetical protein [Alphaproteobacteria bacterium]MBU1824405.1 hypothetical protein [Alphaproteobacteria bacterium]